MNDSRNVKGSPQLSGVPTSRVAVTQLVLLLILVLIALAMFTAPSSLAQKRSPRRPMPIRPKLPAAGDYSRFSHATEKHKAACVTCHKLPTRNWQKARAFPDVADYPDHNACVACHRRQFFKGANPQICSVCHVKTSPKSDARFSFRNPKSAQQFTIEFPHDKHQDVIARAFPKLQSLPAVGFLKASYTWPAGAANENVKAYNNCTICHQKREGLTQSPAGGWVDSFAPTAGTFKTVPETHASCFSCHWKSQPPVSRDCAGCHKAAPPHNPEPVINRISIKFRHAREQHVAECTTCHINITKSTTLRGLMPDVPITSCSECHNKEGLRLDVANELESIDKQHDFVCSYCHTSNIGRKDAPASHYLIAGRPPAKRLDLK